MCAVLWLALVVVPACSDDGGTTGAQTTETTVGAPTSVETTSTDDPVPADVEALLEVVPDDELFDPAQGYLDEDGVLTFDGALALFSAAIVPLPGVEPAPNGDVEEISNVLRVIQRHRAELTAEQSAVFDSVVLAGDALDIDDVLPGPGAYRGMSTEDIQRDASAVAQVARSHFATQLGRLLPFAIRIAVLPATVAGVPVFGPRTLADALLVEEGGTEYCRVRVNEEKYQPGEIRFVMAHEVFHCFQFAIDNGVDGPDWVVEGTAQWAAEEFTGGSVPVSEGWAARWASTPTRPISRRSYDAVGLYALVTELGVPIYDYVDDLLRSPRLATVRAAAGTQLDVEWALSYAGRPSWGDPYALAAGSFGGRGAQRQLVRATVDGGPATFPSPASSRDSGAQVYSLAADGDVLVILGDGYGGIRFDGGDAMAFTGDFAGDFCLKTGGCVCENGTPTGGAGRTIAGQGSRSVFIGWGPQGDASPILEVQSLEQWCNDVPVPDTTGAISDGCYIGLWRTVRMNIPPVNDLPPLVGGDGMTVEFRADGTFIANYDTMQPAIAVIDDKNNVVMSFQFTGVVPGRWSVEPTGEISGSGDLTTLRVLARLIEPVEQEILNVGVLEMFGGGAAPPGVYHVADCRGSSMTITTVWGGGNMSIELQRA